jgi:hypothetical protein
MTQVWTTIFSFVVQVYLGTKLNFVETFGDKLCLWVLFPARLFVRVLTYDAGGAMIYEM